MISGCPKFANTCFLLGNKRERNIEEHTAKCFSNVMDHFNVGKMIMPSTKENGLWNLHQETEPLMPGRWPLIFACLGWDLNGLAKLRC